VRKILTRAAVKRIDAATVESGTASIDLMENAARAFVDAFLRLYRGDKILVLCGPGNNGGDGLAVARLLADKSLDVDVYCLKSDRYSEGFEINLSRLRERNTELRFIRDASELRSSGHANVIVDALYGTGLNKPLAEPAAGVVRWMNAQPAVRISIDVPSGMTEQPPAISETMVNADHVVAFQIYRAELLLPRDAYSPLSISVVDIGLDEDAVSREATTHFLIEASDVKKMLRERRLFDHKWTYGHALLVAGSRKALGAALLATGACLRSGCGLVTVHTVRSGATALNALHPEAMFSPDAHDEMITGVNVKTKFTAVGIGCGVGRATETSTALVDVLAKSKVPCVIDADALNLLSEQHGWKALVPKGSVLTPHQKEFDRLAGDQPNDYERMQRQIALAVEMNCVVVVKGAYTRVALPNGLCCFNSTGTPALATAGTGDVLTGLITGLVARGYTSEDAAVIGVYTHGLAGQLAEEKFGIECVKASDVIDALPLAFKQLAS